MLVKRYKKVENLKELFGDEYTDYNLVFASSCGRPIEGQVINRALKKLIDDNDLPPVVFHSFRHSSINFVSISQAILGIYPDYDGLRIEPCVPDDWKEFTIKRNFRGTQYIISMLRTGRFSIIVDGELIDGCIVPVLQNRLKVRVEVTF